MQPKGEHVTTVNNIQVHDKTDQFSKEVELYSPHYDESFTFYGDNLDELIETLEDIEEEPGPESLDGYELESADATLRIREVSFRDHGKLEIVQDGGANIHIHRDGWTLDGYVTYSTISHEVLSELKELGFEESDEPMASF